MTTSPLSRFENVILKPPIGGSTSDAEPIIGSQVTAKLVRYGYNRSNTSVVDFPEVALSGHNVRSRLQNVYKNLRSGMAHFKVRRTVAGINIAAQSPRNSVDVCWVLFNGDSNSNQAVLAELTGVSGTIRCRSQN